MSDEDPKDKKSEGDSEEDGRELSDILDAVEAAYWKFAVLPPFTSIALALWTVFTHLIDSFDFSPRLHLRSPIKECCWRRCKTDPGSPIEN